MKNSTGNDEVRILNEDGGDQVTISEMAFEYPTAQMNSRQLTTNLGLSVDLWLRVLEF